MQSRLPRPFLTKVILAVELFREILSIDSTSGRERELALWLCDHLESPSRKVMEVGDGTLNLLFCWGSPRVVFCTHMDTVPPYIPCSYADGLWHGRGTCDAKGQIFSMYSACKALEAAGASGFGLLLLSGEETGSHGAKAFSRTGFQAPYLIVGEPTENKMVSAGKGTKSFGLCFRGEPFHSGYPQYGLSAVNLFNEFCNDLKKAEFPLDPLLGETTWNIGQLRSDNPQNVLSAQLECRIYFRTTFASDKPVTEYMASLPEYIGVTPFGGDTPAEYFTLPSFQSAPVAFGSDAPHLTGFAHKAICGPGSIKVAHRDDECISCEDLRTATDQYVKMFQEINRL